MIQARILIVEDDPDAARLTENLLRAAKHQVVGTATTGLEALQLADSTRPDLVIMDIVLPGDLDGIQTANILTQRHDIPVLYLTAYPDEALFERARTTLPSAYLTKPFNEQELKRAIEVALDRHELLRRLKTSEAHLREAQAVAHLGSWSWELEHDRVEVSDELLRLLHLTPGTFEPHFDTFLQLACNEDRAKMLWAVEKHQRGEDPGDVDIRVRSADTPIRVMRLRGSARLDAQGKPITLVGTARDITDEWRAKQDAEAYRDQLEAKVVEATAELRATNQHLHTEIEERLRMEATLRRNEQRYHSLIDNLPEATLVMQDVQVVFANPAAARLLAFPSPNAMRGQVMSELIQPAFLQTYERCKQATLSGQTGMAPTPLEMSRADGSRVEVEVLSFAFDYEDRPAILAVVRDLTARRAMEHEAARFRVALDSSPDAVCLIDPETMRFVDVNSTACISLGYGREELLRLGPQNILPLFNKSMLHEQCAAVFAGKPGAEMVQTLHQRKDGGTFPVEVRIRPFESAGQSLIVAIASDISARVRAEAELRETNARFQQLTENIGEAFWIRDLVENRFLYVNPAYEKLYGKSTDSLYRHPRSFLSSVHPDDRDRVAAAYDDQRILPSGLELEYRVVMEGRIRWLWVRTFPIQDADGKVYRAVGMAQDVTERRESEEQYRALIQASMDGFWVANTQGRLLDCNDATCRITGYGRDELLALSIPDLEASETPEQTAEHIRRIIAQGSDRFETRLRHKNGQVIDIDISTYYRPDAEGGQFFAFLRDITERKQAERALRESEMRFATVFQAASIGIAITRVSDGHIVDFNEALLKIVGYGRDELLGQTTLELGLWAQPEQRAEAIDRLRQDGHVHNLELRIRPKSGESRDGLLSIEPIDLGGEPHMLSLVLDISERKRIEEALRASEARSRAILRAAPVGFGVLVDRVFKEVNAAMTAMTGYGPEELIGQSARMLYANQEDFDHVGTEKYRQIREQGVGSVETRWRCKDGTMIHVALSSAPIVVGDLNKGVIFTAQDITAIKQAEQARLMHEAKQRDALVREVHHRIKNNLQGVIGLLREQAAQAPDLRDFIEAAIAQVNTISVVHGLQSRTPRHEPRLRELLIEICQAAVALAMAPSPPPLQDVLDGDVWLDSGSTVSIALILNELVQNALKHGDQEGNAGVNVVIYGDVTRAVVRISNPGSALPEGFDLDQGTGLGTGLSLVHTLLPRHGAALTILYDGTQVCAELVLTPPVISPPPENVNKALS